MEDLKVLVGRFKAVYKEAMGGEEFPQEPREQLMGAVQAVFRSWDNPRAIVYRRMNDIPGTGDRGERAGDGVRKHGRHLRHGRGVYAEPVDGEKRHLRGIPDQRTGEDVVAGVRTPQPITKLEEDMPECYAEFMELAMKLEEHYRDMQDMEFTIQEGKLYFLQTRNGKRTAPAALRIACELVDEGKITEEEAVLRIEAKSLDQLLHPTFDAGR